MHPHGTFIDSLGGVTEVAREMGIDNVSVVAHWKRRGVPWRHRPEMARLGRIRQVPLPVDIEPFAVPERAS